MHSGRLCKPEREAVFFVTQPDGSSAQPPSPPPLPGLEHLALPRGPKPREDDTVFVFYVFWKEKCSSRTFVDLMSQRLGEKLSRDRPEPRDGSASNTIPIGSLVPCWAHRWSPARAKCGRIRQYLLPPPNGTALWAQRPYMPLGTLRDQIIYPHAPGAAGHTTAEPLGRFIRHQSGTRHCDPAGGPAWAGMRRHPHPNPEGGGGGARGAPTDRQNCQGSRPRHLCETQTTPIFGQFPPASQPTFRADPSSRG